MARSSAYVFRFTGSGLLAAFDLEECQGNRLMDSLTASSDAALVYALALPFEGGPEWSTEDPGNSKSQVGWHPFELAVPASPPNPPRPPGTPSPPPRSPPNPPVPSPPPSPPPKRMPPPPPTPPPSSPSPPPQAPPRRPPLAPPGPQSSRFSVQFDGEKDVLVTPRMSAVRGVSFWLRLAHPTLQPNYGQMLFLLDAQGSHVGNAVTTRCSMMGLVGVRRREYSRRRLIECPLCSP